jgi:AP-4 complex subunit epsilon-1
MTVVDCLEDEDDTIKRKTIALLTKMTNINNVKVITDKLMGIIKNDTYDTHLKAELVSNIADLAERHSPDNKWYVETMVALFDSAGELITTRIISNLIHLLAEWKTDPDLASYVGNKFFEVLTSLTITDGLIKVSTWVIGEFA